MAETLIGTPVGRRAVIVASAVLFAVVVVARLQTFGNPLIHIDEQFYLLVGGRMLHGALPFVDIFDRKPIGLFLIYALARLFPGDGVIAYQLIAAACVWGTALAIWAMAQRVAPPAGALAAAATYVFALNLAGGEGGQAPVLYNLPVALAAFAVLRGVRGDGARLRRRGMVAMGLIGIALQIKYSVVFEGLYLGLCLLALGWQAGRRGALVLDAALWIGCAIAPTAAAAGFYVAIGHFPEWLFANIGSIASRGHELPATVAMRIATMAKLTLPVIFAIVLRRWSGATPTDPAIRADLRFVDGWAASALLGIVLFGTWFNHYVLPLYVPFAVAVAPLATRRLGRIYFAALLIFSLVWGQRLIGRHAMKRGDAGTLAAAVRASGHPRGCVFVYEGPPAYYDAMRSCLLTTRAFPGHLHGRIEQGATGIDEVAEVARIMATRPARVVTIEPAYPEENLAARAQLYRALRLGYRPIFRFGGGEFHFVIYAPNG